MILRLMRIRNHSQIILRLNYAGLLPGVFFILKFEETNNGKHETTRIEIE